LRYGTVCSGIEAPSVAWEPLGWEPMWFSEIEKFPKAVLAHHYPNVPDLGDMTEVNWSGAADVDLLIGGTPCQSFSVAGLRKGMDDPRGNLALEFLRIVDVKRPTWVIWENVPGVLSSSGGRDFGSFVGALAELGYGFCWRVLDAFYFSCACPRPRVFVAGHSRGWSSPAAVLFDGENCFDADRGVGKKARPHTLSTQNTGSRNGRGNAISECGVLRGMTPVETERAMGFPDNYTRIPWRNKSPEDCPDGPRYKALGNSMAVPVVRWIGERIMQVEAIS
jgi:DNA (cytosine-5)-methyltransferase 1